MQLLLGCKMPQELSAGNDNQNRGGRSHPQVKQHWGDLCDVINSHDLRERLNDRHAESTSKDAKSVDGFPIFSSRLNIITYPQKFKPINIDKYDGKRDRTLV